jgi:cell wall-associated NlpC family hydrolase
MSDIVEAFAQAAEALVGTPFRLHGRSREHGLDCVGLVAQALRMAGAAVPSLPTYALRNTDYSHVDKFAAACGLVRARLPVMRGDIIMVQPGPAQRHLLVAVSASAVIHAHAGLRRVVRMDCAPDWPIRHHWTLWSPQLAQGQQT